MLKIAPSILAADFANLEDEINSVKTADFLHIDVMDGHFVPNITIGPCVVAAMRKKSNLIFDVHLMIGHPLKYIAEFAKSGSDYITVHVEQGDDINECIKLIKEQGKKAGLAVSPDTDCGILKNYINDIEIITVMSVYPGFGGQSFIENTYAKIEEISRIISGKDIILSVDGGVNQNNVKKLYQKGVNMVVAGSTVFNAEDRAEMIEILRGEV